VHVRNPAGGSSPNPDKGNSKPKRFKKAALLAGLEGVVGRGLGFTRMKPQPKKKRLIAGSGLLAHHF
jgi:hypothetical protein